MRPRLVALLTICVLCPLLLVSAGLHATRTLAQDGAPLRTAQTDWQAAGQLWWAHIDYLAGDALQGRGNGTPGYQKAADYVAAQFKAAQLTPAGISGYFQPVEFAERKLDPSQSAAALVVGGKAVPLAVGDDVRLDAGVGDPAPVDAPAVFVGYGFAVPEMHYDDFAGVDLRGKIAVLLLGAPSGIPSALMSHFQSSAERWRAMRQAGAIGIAAIPNPKMMEVPWSRVTAFLATHPRYLLADPALNEESGQKLSMAVNPASASRFFEGSGHTFDEIVADADAGRPLPHFPLAVSIRARTAYGQTTATSPNVVGLLPGADAELKKEVVVISAHLDHLGVGAPVDGDPIYHGAMDNASGVASLIEIARSFRAGHLRPKRSILFLVLAGEEEGLLGSTYFAHRPTVPQNEIVADLNMDAFLPLFPLRYLEVQGLAESTLGDDVSAVCEANGVTVQADKVPSANRFIRSDQYSFVKMGVPALAFKFGWTFGSPEEKTYNDWGHTRYHSPADNLSQPVDKAAAAQFDGILTQLAFRIANADSRPAWKPTSFFRRFAQPATE